MGLFDSIFKGGPKPEPEAVSHQLRGNLVAEEFGEVNIRRARTGTEVTFTILMTPEGAEIEGWQTGVALDASASMMNDYGHGLVNGPKGDVPPSMVREYEKKGWITRTTDDGVARVYWSEQAFKDAIAKGYMAMTTNVVEPVAREMTAYLAGQLDADGGTTVIYWACGPQGRDIELLGDFTAEECKTARLAGPKNVSFGNGTHLLPAVRYFADRFADAHRGMYLFITDGRLDDLPAVKQYTIQLARDIQATKRHPLKCVLIGIGDDIDESQMEELDDLDTGTDVDIWDHKIAKEMRALVEIFAEVVSENTIVAPSATVYDDRGQIAARFTDGLPAKASFLLPVGAMAFELEVNGRRIRQPLQ